ncbi:MAG: formylglycine-generating enzyme family protein [Symploca sp. SIO2B6]|nr:formylglycine-generating enzyme family protein [Symploca sp. SIO2B6]
MSRLQVNIAAMGSDTDAISAIGRFPQWNVVPHSPPQQKSKAKESGDRAMSFPSEKQPATSSRGEVEKVDEVTIQREQQQQQNLVKPREGFSNTVEQKFPLSTTSGEVKALGLPLSKVEFETVKVNAKGEVVEGNSNQQAKIFKEDLGNGISLEMVEIPGGSFKMGSLVGEKGRRNSESPQHYVKVPTFFMGRFEVTQQQYQQVMGENPSHFKGDKRPVEMVSWNDAVEFCKKLNQNQTERTYSLPSEAQWEYACRAGETTPFHYGETITDKLANYYANTYASEPAGEYRRETTPVGSFPANGFGLYDMHGNVWEWCLDDWHKNYKGAPTDGSAWIRGKGLWGWIRGTDSNSNKVLRGGSWYYYPDLCRCASRFNFFGRDEFIYDIGFRVVCVGARTM